MSNIIDPPILDSTGQRIAIALEAVNFGHDTSYFSQSSSVQNTEEGVSADILSESTGKRIAAALENIFTDPSGLMHLLNMDSDSDEDIYGFEESYDIREPSERITYIGKNADWDPIIINDDDTGNGSYNLRQWENFKWFRLNKPYMVKKDGTIDYALDPNDYTKKIDGTESDILNQNYDGAGAFSWCEKIYHKETPILDGNSTVGRRVEFSFTKHDGFEPLGFLKGRTVLDGRWIPMFYGSIINGDAKTIGGVEPTIADNLGTILNAVGIKDHNSYYTYDDEVEENFHANIFGGPFVQLMIDLMILFSKTTDCITFYGTGGRNETSSATDLIQPSILGGTFYKTTNSLSYNKVFHSLVLGSYIYGFIDPYFIKYDMTHIRTCENYILDLSSDSYLDTGILYPHPEQGADGGVQQYFQYAQGFGAIPIRPFRDGSNYMKYGCGYYRFSIYYEMNDLDGNFFHGPIMATRYMPDANPYSALVCDNPRSLTFLHRLFPNLERKCNFSDPIMCDREWVVPTLISAFAVLMDPPAPAW